MLRHNRCQFSRCYPKATRVDSSNLQPTPLWDVGCAMVAMNIQTFDSPMQINQGKFRMNGGCGYVLKPAHLRGVGSRRAAREGATPHKLTKIQIKLIGALHLVKPYQERVTREAWQIDNCPLLKAQSVRVVRATSASGARKLRSSIARHDLSNWRHKPRPAIWRREVSTYSSTVQ